MERTWTQRLEEASREKHRQTADGICQTDEIEDSSVTITIEELDSRLKNQKLQLQLEADKVKHKAVEEARKRAQRELHEKHLEDMAKQVSGLFIICMLVSQNVLLHTLYLCHLEKHVEAYCCF